MHKHIGMCITIFGALLANIAAANAVEKEQLSGKTLTAGKAVIKLLSNGKIEGSISGEPLAGSWSVKGGKFCRTIKLPTRLKGSECQKVTFKGNTVTFISVSGRKATYSIK